MIGALAVTAAFALSTALVVPAARRTRLDVWHPAGAWLLLEAVFFGIGGVSLAIWGSPGPALFIAGAVAAFGLGTWMSDVLARRRSIGIDRVGNESTRLTAPLRPAVVAALVCLAVLAVGATVLRVGVPLFAGDITGARSELTGIPVQILRVALPGAALALTVAALRTPGDQRARLGAVALVSATLLFEIVLASRYLAAELVAGLVLALGIAGVPVPRRAVAVTVAAGVLAFAGIQVVRAYDQAAGREVAFAVERTANRLFLIQPRTLEALQAAIPSEQPYFGGLTWLRRAGPFFGRNDIPNLGYWIYPRLFPDQTPPGYAAPGLLGEAWANFGGAGILLFGLLGVVVERFGALVARHRAAVADVVAAALGTLFIARSHALGLNGLVVLGALVALWRALVAWPAGLLEDVGATLRWRI